MLQAFKPRVDLRIRMLGQRQQEQLDCSPCDRQIVVEGMRGEGDRTRVKRGESPQVGQGLLQVIACLDNRSSNMSLHVYHDTPPIPWSMGELFSSSRGQTYYLTVRRRRGAPPPVVTDCPKPYRTSSGSFLPLSAVSYSCTNVY